MHHDILRMVGILMRAILLFTIGSILAIGGSSSLAIIDAIHILIPLSFTLLLLVFLVILTA